MLQISTDIVTLTPSQREALAAFIITFPTSEDTETPSEDADEVIQTAITAFEEAGISISPEEAFAERKHPEQRIDTPAVADHLDKNGLPWDERIHASSHAKTVDGSWRMKRGVDDALVTEVEGGLKALMSIPAPPIVVPAGSISIEEATQARVNGRIELLSVAPPPTPPVAVAPPPPPPAPAAGDKAAYIKLVTVTLNAIRDGKLTQESLAAAVQSVGVPELKLLANRLDLVPQVMQTIEALIA